MPHPRLLKASDSVEAKALLLLQQDKVSILGMDEDEILAEVKSDLDGDTNKEPYIVKIARSPPFGIAMHTCTCIRFAYVPKRLHFFWGKHAIVLTPECSHIYAVKLMPAFQTWWREISVAIPENLRSFIRNTRCDSVPLDLTRLDPENRRRKISFVSSLSRAKKEEDQEEKIRQLDAERQQLIKRIYDIRKKTYWEED